MILSPSQGSLASDFLGPTWFSWLTGRVDWLLDEVLAASLLLTPREDNLHSQEGSDSDLDNSQQRTDDSWRNKGFVIAPFNPLARLSVKIKFKKLLDILNSWFLVICSGVE